MGEPNIAGGYILLSRKMVESEIFSKPPLYIKVWVYLLSKAQHSDYKQLKRGQLRTNIPEIIEACSWYVGYRKEYPTKDQVFQILEWLRNPRESTNETDTKATMITTTKATQGMIITIENYSFYQDCKNYESNNETNDEEQVRATREQREPNNINKNDKNDKELKNINKQQGFDSVINAYTENSELKNTIIDFIKMRKATKKPMTDKAVELMLKKLSSLSDKDTTKIEILNQSIERSWQGIFPLKEEDKPKEARSNAGAYEML